MIKPLRERIILSALKALKEGDPLLVIGVGDSEVRFGWMPEFSQVIDEVVEQ